MAGHQPQTRIVFDESGEYCPSPRRSTPIFKNKPKPYVVHNPEPSTELSPQPLHPRSFAATISSPPSGLHSSYLARVEAWATPRPKVEPLPSENISARWRRKSLTPAGFLVVVGRRRERTFHRVAERKRKRREKKEEGRSVLGGWKREGESAWEEREGEGGEDLTCGPTSLMCRVMNGVPLPHKPRGLLNTPNIFFSGPS